MAANHGRSAPSYITDDHYRRLLSGDHLHHGLLGRAGVEVRIGIHTGEVVMRMVQTGGHTEYSPVGHVINLASRMQSLAPPGGIVVSEETRRLVEGYFELRSLGPTAVKGVAEPIDVYEIVGIGALRGHFDLATRRGLTKFVGRERELEQMQHALELAVGDHGQIVSVIAEAGTGKSRLFHEFKATIPKACKVLEAYSVSHGKATPWLPVLELLRSYFGLRAEDNPPRRCEKVRAVLAALDHALDDTLPYLFGLFGIREGSDAIAQMEPQVKRRRTLEVIKRIIIRESLNQPLVMVFEDLHWIDAETQDLLDLLADSIANSRVLLLFSYRPEYHHGWSNKSNYSQLRLDPLDPTNASAMLGAILGGENAELAQLEQLVVDRTGGNPFFIEEMVQALFDEGVLNRNGTVRVVRPLSQLRLPPTVQGILAARIDRLPPDEKDLLQTLAVIGRESPLALIRQVSPRTKSQLEPMLAALRAAEFIHERPSPAEAEYRFKHALTQQAAYESLLIGRRKLVHERVGEALESLFADYLEDHLGALAHHFSQTDNVVKGLEYQSRAGEQAQRRYAYSTAVAHFTQALKLIERTLGSIIRDRQELSLRLSLGLNLMAITSIGSPVVHENFSRARELCLNRDENPNLLPALWGLCWFYIGKGDLDTARELGNEMLALAANSSDRMAWLLTDTALGPALVWSGDFASASTRLEHGYALYDHKRPDPAITDFGVICLSYLSFSLWSLGFPDQALNKVRESLILARRLGHVHSIGHALSSVALVHWFRRDIQDLDEYAKAAIEFATEHELGFWEPMGRILKGFAMSEQGDKAQAELGIRRGLDSYQATGAELSLPMFLGGLIELFKKTGRIEDALGTLDTAFTMTAKGGRLHEAELFRHKGELMLMQNPGIEETDKSLHSALKVARHQGAKSFELRTTISFARLLAKQDRRDEARTMLSDIYNWFTEGFDTADLKDAKTLLNELNG